MLHKGRLLIVALALIDASAASAQQGGDLCFQFGSGGGTLVARRFGQLPADAHCKPLQFYEDGPLEGTATGSICKDRNGGTFILHYTYHSCKRQSHFQTVTCRFSAKQGLPTSGQCRGTDTNGGFFNTTPTLRSCDQLIPESVGLCSP
jgi:hypothetical protein